MFYFLSVSLQSLIIIVEMRQGHSTIMQHFHELMYIMLKRALTLINSLIAGVHSWAKCLGTMTVAFLQASPMVSSLCYDTCEKNEHI